jgi:hypothetical protein
MTEKRGEVIEKVDASQTIPNIYEDWIEKQVKARSVLSESQTDQLGKQEEEDREEDEIDRTEDLHEKAHRRKRGKGAPSSS